jgi:hypothetical protein
VIRISLKVSSEGAKCEVREKKPAKGWGPWVWVYPSVVRRRLERDYVTPQYIFELFVFKGCIYSENVMRILSEYIASNFLFVFVDKTLHD